MKFWVARRWLRSGLQAMERGGAWLGDGISASLTDAGRAVKRRALGAGESAMDAIDKMASASHERSMAAAKEKNEDMKRLSQPLEDRWEAALSGRDEAEALATVLAMRVLNANNPHKTALFDLERALAKCARMRQPMGVRALIAGQANHRAPVNGRVPMEHAAVGGCVESAMALREAGAPIVMLDKGNKKTKRAVSHETPMSIAVHAGDVAFVRWLLDEGADPNAVDGRGMSALRWVATSVDPRALTGTAMLDLLIERGADPSALDAEGRAPFMKGAAIGLGGATLAALIQMAQGQLDALDVNGDTAAVLAAKAPRPESLALLLDAGADGLLPGRDGATPLSLAARRNWMSRFSCGPERRLLAATLGEPAQGGQSGKSPRL